jgi:quaternary ammonium compound-resistance protein SugE
VSWFLLVVAGLLEVAWASVLPTTAGLTKPWPTALFLVLLAGSMFGLARASESIPIGTAYVVWVGIGAVGAVIAGWLLHGEALAPARALWLVLLVVAVAGVKLTSPH